MNWQEQVANMEEGMKALDVLLDHLSSIQNEQEEIDVDGVLEALKDFDPGEHHTPVLIGTMVFLKNLDEEYTRGHTVFQNILKELKERSSLEEYVALTKYLNV